MNRPRPGTPRPDTASATASASAPDSTAEQLRTKIEDRTATIAVVGLGYVGLPLVQVIHDSGFPVLGYDADATKVRKLEQGEAYIHHLGQDLTRRLAASDRFHPTADPKKLSEADAILLCVPTPLGRHREPDLSFVLDCTNMVARVLRPGQLIVLESTTYPGTTRDRMGPILDATGLECGRDYFLAYSPVRENPGGTEKTQAIPKLVGGVDETSTDLAVALYERLVEQVHRVPTAEVAEAAKLLENIYRAVNIALVNELKVLLAEMGIDVWDVIQAASTKPFGFQAFYPGPGLGGHCIPIDPFYLAWKAREHGRTTRFIELAGEINASMPEYVVSRVMAALNERSRALRGSHVLVIGIAYKPNIDDSRESPAAEIIEGLWAGGATVSYHDPLVPSFPEMRDHKIDLDSQPLTEAIIEAHDVVLIVTDHDAVDYDLIGRAADLVVDTRNAMARVASPNATVVKA